MARDRIIVIRIHITDDDIEIQVEEDGVYSDSRIVARDEVDEAIRYITRVVEYALRG